MTRIRAMLLALIALAIVVVFIWLPRDNSFLKAGFGPQDEPKGKKENATSRPGKRDEILKQIKKQGLIDFVADLAARNDELKEELAKLHAVNSTGSALRVGKNLIQWGTITTNMEKSYTTVKFNEPFGKKPIVLVTVDGAWQNDVSCNVANTEADSFAVVAFSPSAGYPSRPIFWVAFGTSK